MTAGEEVASGSPQRATRTKPVSAGKRSARNGKGLARDSLGQKAETFLNMAQKQFIQMTRYPVSFFTSFGQVFLIFLIFFFGFTVFLAEPAQEWASDGAMEAPFGEVWVGRNTTHVIVALDYNSTEYLEIGINGSSTFIFQWQPDDANLSSSPTSWGMAMASEGNFLEVAFPINRTRDGNFTMLISTISHSFPSGAHAWDNSSWMAMNVDSLGKLPSFASLDGRMTEEEDDSGDLGAMVILGLIMFLFLSETLWNIGMSIRDEQYQGTLESLYLTPASKFTNMISRVAPMLTWNGLMAAFVLAFMYVLVGGIPLDNPHIALLVLVFTVPGTLGVGFIFAALALRLKESVELLANISQFGLMLLTGMMFPFRVLPWWVVDYGSRLIPLSYSVDAFRCALLGRTPELAPMWVELVIIVSFGVLMPIIGYAIFHWQEHEARKKGSLSEY